MKNDNNLDFYKKIKINRLREFAKAQGLSEGADVRQVYSRIARAGSLVELGFGYGRVIDVLLNLGFEGKITAIDRVGEFVGLLKRKYFGKVDISRQDIKKLILPQPPDAFMWMWSGFLELSPEEQQDVLIMLSDLLAPKGLIIIEIPYRKIHVVGKQEDEHSIRVETDWGVLEAYMPDENEMKTYAGNANLTSEPPLVYKTDTGIERVIYIMQKKPVHYAPSEH